MSKSVHFNYRDCAELKFMSLFCFYSASVTLVHPNYPGSLLCGRRIGRIARLVRSSVCLSVLPSDPYRLATRKTGKIDIGINVLQGTYEWSSSFQLKRSKVKVT